MLNNHALNDALSTRDELLHLRLVRLLHEIGPWPQLRLAPVVHNDRVYHLSIASAATSRLLDEINEPKRLLCMDYGRDTPMSMPVPSPAVATIHACPRLPAHAFLARTLLSHAVVVTSHPIFSASTPACFFERKYIDNLLM